MGIARSKFEEDNSETVACGFCGAVLGCGSEYWTDEDDDERAFCSRKCLLAARDQTDDCDVPADDDYFTEPDEGFDNPADDYIHEGYYDPNDHM